MALLGVKKQLSSPEPSGGCEQKRRWASLWIPLYV